MMTPSWVLGSAALTCLFLATQVKAQPGEFLVTATNSLNSVHHDGVLQNSTPNGDNWQDIDVLPIDTYARVVAVSANNFLGGCSGILAAIEGSPLDLNFRTNNVTWRCNPSPPTGWELPGFDDSSWSPARQVGRNGEIVPGCSWIPLPAMPLDAFWIWTPDDDGADTVVSCRGYTGVCSHAPCQNGGTCDSNGVALCSCPVRYAGRFCEQSVQECDSHPCMRGGRCELIDVQPGYECFCAPQYTGTRCETDLTDCASSPCLHGGTCNFIAEGGYECECRAGYTGFNCETDIDECESEPCLNDATCHDDVNDVVCECAPGYEGKFCDSIINECLSNPCQNAGTCEDQVNGYTCHCNSGHTGTNCETPIGLCEIRPCFNGGTCTLDGPDGGIQCICTDGWSGLLCDNNENECASNPCQNGGWCKDYDDMFECDCLPEYQGVVCEHVVPHCGSIMALSPYPPVRNFWAMCEIDILNHRDYLAWPCRDLITGVNVYNDSSTITAIGGSFGCFVSKYPDEMPTGACVENYNQDVMLANCLSCTHLGVCIRVPGFP